MRDGSVSNKLILMPSGLNGNVNGTGYCRADTPGDVRFPAKAMLFV